MSGHNRLPYYKRYPRDFIEGTIGMSLELKGAYGLILDLIYMQSGKLQDDPRYISGLLGCSVRKWKSIRSELVRRRKVIVSGEFLTNYRVEKELETLSNHQDKQRENRSNPNKNKDLQSPKSNHSRDYTEPEPKKEKRDTNVSPKSSPKTELEKVLDPEHSKAVIEHRTKLKKTLSAYAAKLLAGKFAKCPDPNAAADVMISNGWQGFEPSWLDRDRPNQRGSPKTPAHELADRMRAAQEPQPNEMQPRQIGFENV